MQEYSVCVSCKYCARALEKAPRNDHLGGRLGHLFFGLWKIVLISATESTRAASGEGAKERPEDGQGYQGQGDPHTRTKSDVDRSRDEVLLELNLARSIDCKDSDHQDHTGNGHEQRQEGRHGVDPALAETGPQGHKRQHQGHERDAGC